MNNSVRTAIRLKAIGEMAVIAQNIKVYISNSAGIGEHPKIAEELITLYREFSEWNDVLKAITDVDEFEEVIKELKDFI